MKTIHAVIAVLCIALIGCGTPSLAPQPEVKAGGGYGFVIAIYNAIECFFQPPLPDDLKKPDGAAPVVEPDSKPGDLLPAVPIRPVATITVDVLASGCTHCERLRKDVKDYTGLKFVFRIVNSTAPVLHWKVGNTNWRQEGWPGLKAFIKVYNDSLKVKPATATATHANQRQESDSHYSVEGDWTPSRSDVMSHLQRVHGFSRDKLKDMSREQLLSLHDQQHEND